MNVLIVAEQQGGKLRRASLNALSAGRLLAQKTGGELHLALLGSGLGPLAGELCLYGGRTLHLLDDPRLEDCLAEPCAQAISGLAREIGAGWIGAASTSFARDVLPRVAARLDAGMASDVVRFEGGAQAVRAVRPSWAGRALAEVEIATPIKVFTVRPSDFPAAEKVGEEAGLRRVVPQLSGAPRTRLLERRPLASARPELTEARVVVAGGHGIKGDVRALEELADALGGAVGASRSAVDEGWLPDGLQIGQTGKVVAPELYVAVGISGAAQHVAGMKGARVIVAVDSNPEAPIFQVADYGLVGDAAKVLPELSAAIRALESQG